MFIVYKSVKISYIVAYIATMYMIGENMKIKSLIAFKYVYTKGSIATASNYVHLSVSAISRLITNLEEDLQFKLFSRKGRKLIPTYEGKRFYKEVESLLENIDKMNNVVNELSIFRKNTLRIISVNRIAQFLSAFVIADFLNENAHIDIKIDIRPRREIEELLSEKEYDIGFGFLPVQDENTFVKPLMKIRTMAILHKNHPFAGKKTITMHALKDEKFIRLNYGTALREHANEIFDVAGVQANSIIDVPTSQIACSLVAQGAGITIADEMIATPFKDSVSVIPIEPEVWTDVGILYPTESSTKENVKIFEALMLEKIKFQFSNNDSIRWI